MMAIHDLTLAAQYCQRIGILRNGVIYALGTPTDVLTGENVLEVYGAHVHVLEHPVSGLPVVLPVAEQVNLDPRALAWAAPVSAGMAFVLPTSTPALAMVFGTGYLRIRHTLPGIVITFCSLAVFIASVRWLWPLFDLPALGVSP